MHFTIETAVVKITGCRAGKRVAGNSRNPPGGKQHMPLCMKNVMMTIMKETNKIWDQMGSSMNVTVGENPLQSRRYWLSRATKKKAVRLFLTKAFDINRLIRKKYRDMLRFWKIKLHSMQRTTMLGKTCCAPCVRPREGPEAAGVSRTTPFWEFGSRLIAS